MTSRNSANQMELESLAKDAGESLHRVEELYEREFAALQDTARITNFLPLLALRRVRYQLLPVTSSRVH